jgi:hypothetical protein
MAKFDDFYNYLRTFLEELRGEGLVMRMKKHQKVKIMHMREVSDDLDKPTE